MRARMGWRLLGMLIRGGDVWQEDFWHGRGRTPDVMGHSLCVSLEVWATQSFIIYTGK